MISESQKKQSESQEADEGHLEAGEPAMLGHTIPRPSTNLEAPPRGAVAGFTVTWLGDLTSALSLQEVDRINKDGDSEARTPVMTLIHSLLAERGGAMPLDELTAQVVARWNRPFPSSPYSAKEFLYVVLRNSDSVRVSE